MYSWLEACHPDWKSILTNALQVMDSSYLQQLNEDNNWLPGGDRLFAGFSLPLEQTHYILFGESPYPRAESANGYAFWDNAVDSLWSSKGLSTAVNRATSLRNWIKMMLVARGDLELNKTSQECIASLDKDALTGTAQELFCGMMTKGILLLNACLVYSEGRVPYHARHWKPFMESLLSQLVVTKPDIKLILFGKIAENIPQNKLAVGLIAEHPYNVTFISNQKVLDFFRPLDLMSL